MRFNSWQNASAGHPPSVDGACLGCATVHRARAWRWKASAGTFRLRTTAAKAPPLRQFNGTLLYDTARWYVGGRQLQRYRYSCTMPGHCCLMGPTRCSIRYAAVWRCLQQRDIRGALH
jgi:hypothetical protein